MFRIETRDDLESRRFWLIEASFLAAVAISVGVVITVLATIPL